MLQSLLARPFLRRSTMAATALAAVLALGACSATYESKEVGNCSPEYSIGDAQHGHIRVAQRAENTTIGWGLYVESEYKIGSQFSVQVYAGGVKIDNKNQNYEPHGSIGVDKATKYSGKILEIRGTVTTADDDTLIFSAKCRIA